MKHRITEAIRHRLAIAACLLTLGLCATGCSTSAICERACDAWEGCWSYDECMDDCEADGDWSSAYADCCEDHAGDCIDLEVICG